MIAAGVNAKVLSTFMGHEAEAAALLDNYVEAQRGRAEEAARAAGGALTGA